MRTKTLAVTLLFALLLLSTAQTARAQDDVLAFAGQLKDENAQVRALAAERLLSLLDGGDQRPRHLPDQVSGLGPRMVTMHRHGFRTLRVGGQTTDSPRGIR